MNFVYKQCDTQQLYCSPPKTATKKAVALLHQEGKKICQPMDRSSENHGFVLGPPQIMPNGCVRVGTLQKHNRTRNKFTYSPVKRRRIQEPEQSSDESFDSSSDESFESSSDESLDSSRDVCVPQERLLNTALAANLQPHVVQSVVSLNGKVCIFNEYPITGKCWACNRKRTLTHTYGNQELVGRLCAKKINAAVKACVSLHNAQKAEERAYQSINSFIETAQNVTDRYLKNA